MRWWLAPVFLTACESDTEGLRPTALPPPPAPVCGPFTAARPRCALPWAETFVTAPQNAVLDARAEKLLYGVPGALVTVDLVQQLKNEVPLDGIAHQVAATPDFSQQGAVLATGEIYDIYWWGKSSGYLSNRAEPWRKDGHRVSVSSLHFSAGGDYLLFDTSADSFGLPDDNLLQDVYRVRVADGDLTRISYSGRETDGPSYFGQAAPDGQKVWFVSTAPSLGARAVGEGDVFIWQDNTVTRADYAEPDTFGLVVSGNTCTVVTAHARRLVARRLGQTQIIQGQEPVVSYSGRFLAYRGEDARPRVRDLDTGAEAGLDAITQATQVLHWSGDDGYLVAKGYGPNCPNDGDCADPCGCTEEGLYVVPNPLLPDPCHLSQN